MTIVCVFGKMIYGPQCHPLKRIVLCLPQFFFSQDCSICPHGSWAFCSVELEKGD